MCVLLVEARGCPSNRMEWKGEGAYKSFLLRHDRYKEEKEKKDPPWWGVETVAKGAEPPKKEEMTMQCNVPLIKLQK